MITNRERERQTLDFRRPEGRGVVEETFAPWDLTVERFKEEGLPVEIAEGVVGIVEDAIETKNLEIVDNIVVFTNHLESNEAVYEKNAPEEKYLQVKWGEGVMRYEEYLGFDPVRRIHFALPFQCFDVKIIEETTEHIMYRNTFGQQMIRNKVSQLEVEHRPVVVDWQDWEALKERGDRELEKYYTEELIQKAFGPLVPSHQRGDYSIRLNIKGFFWVPRELMGIEAHLFAFYDEPELLHDMNEYILKIYQNQLMKVLEWVQPDVIYILEDLSGGDGPMISPECFDEFVGAYYKRLFPLLKKAGVGNVMIDTDGDFEQLIPNFIETGVDGFLPMDVNAGMDIVEIRKKFPHLKFIGSFNKLEIAKGREAIDREFQRLLPVIRQGGFIPGADHQVAPSTSLEDYRYYITRLKEVMKQAGADIVM